tara:strand:+ start:1456 stop:1719 length:264 start_codon:yes stop_codon:yes gene_type:complete
MKAVYNNRGTRVPGMIMKEGGSFPDLSGDGKITKKDVLMGRGVIKKKKGGSTETKKDSCYYKAKAAHKVFPSAYASGMIAKCRKKKG